MRLLFAVDSFFQLIEATNLRLSLYKSDNADVAIYSSTPNAKRICENLNRAGVFRHCFYIDTPLTRCGAKYSFKEKLPKYFVYPYTLVNPKGYTKSLGIENLSYDRFIFVGNGVLPECIFNALKQSNRKLDCMRYEDSYISYTKKYGKIKNPKRVIFENTVRKLFGGYDIERYIKGYYFSEPELVQVKFDYPVLAAPKISRDNKTLIEILNNVFGYENIQDTYEEKYIFFESGDAYFEKNNEDVGFIESLANIVGKNQILIKRHPRCTENRFAKLGVPIAEASGIPWELIQFNRNMDGKVFLTTTSAAALSSEIYFGDDCKIVLLFEAMKHKPNSVTDTMKNYMLAFQRKYGENRLYLPKNDMEFQQLIKEI